MSFAEPGALPLLLLAPLAAAIAAGLWWRWRRAARQWIAPYLWRRLLPRHDPRLSAATVILLALSVAGLALALARPQRPVPEASFPSAISEPAPSSSSGSSLPRDPAPGKTIPGNTILALDTSFSMAAQDVRPSRLALAQRALRELASALPEHRLALVQWEAEPRVLSPLTADHGLILVQAEGLEAGSMDRPGSALTPALEVAADLLGSTDPPTPSGASRPSDAQRSGGFQQPRAVVVITDGEDHTEDSRKGLPEELAKTLRGAGITVHGILVGTREGSRLPLPEGGFKRDANGREVLSRAREEPLLSLVRETGGILLRAERADASLAPLLRILRSAPGSSAGETRGPYQDGAQEAVQEVFQGPLLLAALALMAHLLLGDGPVRRPSILRRLALLRRPGSRTGTTALLCLLSLVLISGQAPAPPDREEEQEISPTQNISPTQDINPTQNISKWQGKRSLSRLAAEAYAEGDGPLAAAAADAALEKDPNDPVLLFNAGTARLQTESDAQTLELLKRAADTAKDPMLAADAWYNLGTAYLAAGDRRRAIRTLEEALRRNPDHRPAQLNLEWALRPPPDPEREDDSSTPPGRSPQNRPPQPQDPTGGAGTPSPDPGSAGERFQPQPDLSPEAARSLLRAVEDLERNGHRQDSEPRRRSTGARDW